MADQRTQNQPQAPMQSQPQNQPREGAMEARRSNERTSEMERGSTGSTMSSPFSFMRRFMSEMDRLFDDFGHGPMSRQLRPFGESFGGSSWAPQMDVFERGGQLIVHADLPGTRQEDVRVTVEDGVLTISGERSHTHEHENGGVYQCERSYGRFQRSMALPEGVDPNSVQANFENGVLEVTMPMPKQQQTRGRQIPVGAKTGTTGVKH